MGDRLAVLEAKVASLEAEKRALRTRVATLENCSAVKLSPYLTVTSASTTKNNLQGPHVIFTGVNLHVRNGTGATASVNGLGNLIIGYNEHKSPWTPTEPRTGSHNLVVGSGHVFSSFGGLVAGYWNTITAAYASVSGGYLRSAVGEYDWWGGALFQPY